MNLLDVLFSREIKRRTGAHAVSIYIDEKNTKNRLRLRGKKASVATNQTKITTKNTTPNFFRRIDIRFPWLKLVTVLIIGVAATVDLMDFTISKAGDNSPRIAVAPFKKHVRLSERVFEGKKLVALTFDDGPSGETTSKLIDILYEKDVPATFFMLGNSARAYPEIVKRAERKGNEIASHTTYHQNLIQIPSQGAEADINESKAIFKEILKHDVKYTRPPYGNTNAKISRIINTPLILWSVDSEDWKSKDPESILSITMSEIHDGAIILMHDIYPTTVEAVPKLIKTIRDAGYEFVTISELANKRGVRLANKEVYYNIRP